MQNVSYRLAGWTTIAFVTLLVLSLSAQGQGPLSHPVIPQPKPLIKLIGFLNATPAANNIRPILTLKLPGEDKPYTFLLTDMKIMAGPFRTPESILSEVKPYKPNFHVRTSREITAQLVTTSPTEQLTILALYSHADRVLVVESVEKSDGAAEQDKK